MKTFQSGHQRERLRPAPTWLPLPLHALLSVGEQPLQGLQDVAQRGAEQRVDHGRQGLGGRGSGALRRGGHLLHGRGKVAAADGDGGDVQQELLGGAVDLRVAAPQSAQRRFSADRSDVSATVT